MSFARGTPAGVTGLLDLTGNAQYFLYVTAWKRSLTIPTIPRPGRGLTRWEAFRRMNVGSVISFRANVTGGPGVASGFPTPVVIENSSGSVTIQYDSGKTVVFAGDVVGYSESLDEEKQDNWIIGVTLKLTTRPVYAGFGGTQPTPSAATVADQQTDAGLSQNYDPVGLQTRATQRIDIGTITDTDAADLVKLQAYTASALATTSAPMPTLIPRTAQFIKTDRAGGAITTEWGKRDTGQDITFPESFQKIDAYLIESVAASSIIYHTSATPPSAPAAPTGLQYVSVETQQLDRTLSKKKFDYEINNSQQKIEFAHSENKVDPYLLDTFITSAIVYHTSGAVPTPSVPSGLQIVSVNTTTKTPLLSEVVYDISVTNSQQKVVIAGTESLYSAIQANRHAVASILTSSSTDEAVAASQWAGLQGTQNLLNLQIKSLDPYRKRQILNFIDPGIQVLSISSGGSRLAETKIASGVVKVFVLSNVKFGASYRSILLSRVRVDNAPLRRFIISRMILQSPPIPEFASQFGTTNNASFLGLSAGTVKYNSCSDSTKLNFSGTMSFFLGYHFENDSLGYIQQLPEQWFRVPQICNTSVTTEGDWVTASSLGLTFTPAASTQTDFSGFLA